MQEAAACWGHGAWQQVAGKSTSLHHSLLPSSSRAAPFCHTLAHNHSLFPKFSKFTFETMLPEPHLYLQHDAISDTCENTPTLSAFCARATECPGHVVTRDRSHVAECVMTMEIVYSLQCLQFTVYSVQAPDNEGTRGGVWPLWSKGQRNSR